MPRAAPGAWRTVPGFSQEAQPNRDKGQDSNVNCLPAGRCRDPPGLFCLVIACVFTEACTVFLVVQQMVNFQS